MKMPILVYEREIEREGERGREREREGERDNMCKCAHGN